LAIWSSVITCIGSSVYIIYCYLLLCSTSERKREGRHGVMKKFFVSYASLVLAFMYLPILVLIIFSFNRSKISANWEGFTFEWYTKLFQDSYVIDAAINSIVIAIVTTVITVVLGTLCALALYKYRFKWQGMIEGTIYLPILIPDILMGLSLLILFSQLHFRLNHVTIIISHVTFSISYVVVILLARLKG